MPKQLPARIQIHIDTQEQRSGIPAILAAMPQVHIEVAPLRVGDYEERQTPLPCRLVIQPNGLGSYTLVNQGSIVGMLSDEDTLKAYQDEFMTFAEYLKSIWE